MKEESDIQTDKNMRDQELAYLENELNIHKALQRSQHVTVREKQANNAPEFMDACEEEKEYEMTLS